MEKYTAVVIGGGPSGHSCAMRISQLGGRVALVERDFIGGICTNWGCTPSKAMIESAKIARDVKDSHKYGIDVSDFQINFARVAARRNQVVLQTRQSVTDLLNHHKVDLYQGEAQITAPGKVRVLKGKLDADGEEMHYDGGEDLIEAEHIIIATGSKPLIPGFVDKNDPSIVSSNRLITIDERPEKLTIVGGGVIGLEFATIFSNLGSQVTVVEFLDRVLAGMDEDISAEITAQMEANGVRILTSHKVLSVKGGILTAENQKTGEEVKIECSMTLIAIGRMAVVHEETYTTLGIEHTLRGVNVNDYQQTNVPGIWAVGDATGKSILAHVGIQQGIVAAENIMQKSSEALREMDYEVIPAVIYSLPEIVGVGTVPQGLDGVQVVKVPFAANLRASIEDFTDGFLKLWIRNDRVIAAQAIGHGVSEIMQELANMIALKTDIHDVAEIIHAHPTYAEIIRSALEYSLGKAVDFYI
ncbi:MAG: dihydrolipoyl dehydrogenase [Anaerolineaceae bacterium]|nr:dihydrolipoyl dehydrogenase [Anaerolineaceae bacterium]